MIQCELLEPEWQWLDPVLCFDCADCAVVQEEDYGRARVHTQWGDDEEAIREAVEMCPVDCISFVRICHFDTTGILATRWPLSQQQKNLASCRSDLLEGGLALNGCVWAPRRLTGSKWHCWNLY